MMCIIQKMYSNISKLIKVEVLISQIVSDKSSEMLEIVAYGHSNRITLVCFFV